MAAHPELSVVDPHHHFFDPVRLPALYKTVSAIGLKTPYLPDDHARDFSDGPAIKASVHVEVIPDEWLQEVQFVLGLESPTIQAIVAHANLSHENVAERLSELAAASPKVRGIRCITNWDGPVGEGESPIASRATWPRVERDYSEDPAFAAGLSLLPSLGLSFDLQCNPPQLQRWAATLQTIPDLMVVLDHMGHLRALKGDGGAEDEAQIATWRRGMAALAENPNVYVKLSMLG